MSVQDLNSQLLRPFILQTLRSVGFHSTKPSVLDTITSLTQNYLLLLATRTAEHAYENHNTLEPSLTDVRMALEDVGAFSHTLTSAEEAWKEVLRRPLSSFPERNGIREKEKRKRDEEDTGAVREFTRWFSDPKVREIKRVAGLEEVALAGVEGEKIEDYLTVLKKKHSKTGEESRYQGTVLGIPADDRQISIEGGPADSLEEWNTHAKSRATKLAAIAHGNGYKRGANNRSISEEDAPGEDMDLEDAPGETLDDESAG